MYLLWLQVTNVATIVQFDYWLIFSLCLECHVVAKTSIFDLSRPITQSIKLLLFSKNLLVRKRFVAKYRSIKIVNEIWNGFNKNFKLTFAVYIYISNLCLVLIHNITFGQLKDGSSIFRIFSNNFDGTFLRKELTVKNQ